MALIKMKKNLGEFLKEYRDRVTDKTAYNRIMRENPDEDPDSGLVRRGKLLYIESAEKFRKWLRSRMPLPMPWDECPKGTDREILVSMSGKKIKLLDFLGEAKPSVAQYGYITSRYRNLIAQQLLVHSNQELAEDYTLEHLGVQKVFWNGVDHFVIVVDFFEKWYRREEWNEN